MKNPLIDPEIPLEKWRKALHLQASVLGQIYEDGLADKHLRQLADALEQIPHALPTMGACPYCKAQYLLGHYDPELRGVLQTVAHPMVVIEWLCSESEDYMSGYRARWQCQNPACREEEIR